MRKTGSDEWRLQSDLNKQGSQGSVNSETGVLLTREEQDFQTSCKKLYESRLNLGIAREQARKDLPLSTYTEAYWKIDLHNLLHFLSLRMDTHAQYEIRQYASVIGHEIVAKWLPLTWEAFQDYRVQSMNLSGPEIVLISLLVKGDADDVLTKAREMGWITGPNDEPKPGREARELSLKLDRFGLTPPW